MNKLWEKILESLTDGTFAQGFITVAFVGTTCALVLTSREIPELMAFGLTSVLGFYFGSQAAMMVLKSKRESE
ncbi:MAG: hypothetical protein KAJ19_28320 [Gammaproteobacteria bacterium]|nr:hypothetical protein [Gammaproteobacteria bacterium]